MPKAKKPSQPEVKKPKKSSAYAALWFIRQRLLHVENDAERARESAKQTGLMLEGLMKQVQAAQEKKQAEAEAAMARMIDEHEAAQRAVKKPGRSL